MRVFIAEDQFLLRQGLENLLVSHGVPVVATTGSGEALVESIMGSGASLALLDVRMPPTHTDEGIRAARDLRRRAPGFPVVLLSQYVEQLYLDELLAGGVEGVGYLLKDRVFDDVTFVASVRTVAGGGSAIDPAVVSALLQRRQLADRLNRLTPREVEVLTRMAEGLDNPTISKQLFITDKAVQKHVNAIFAKLDLADAPTTARRVRAVLTLLRGQPSTQRPPRTGRQPPPHDCGHR